MNPSLSILNNYYNCLFVYILLDIFVMIICSFFLFFLICYIYNKLRKFIECFHITDKYYIHINIIDLFNIVTKLFVKNN